MLIVYGTPKKNMLIVYSTPSDRKKVLGVMPPKQLFSGNNQIGPEVVFTPEIHIVSRTHIHHI